MKDLVKIICDQLECESITTLSKDPISFKNYADITKLKNKLGDTFKLTNIIKSIEKTIEYYKKII